MSTQILTHAQVSLRDVIPNSQHPVRLRARAAAAAELFNTHSHAWGQIMYAPEGIVRVNAANSTWILAPLRAIWIPAHVPHEIATIEKSQLRILYIDTKAAPFSGQNCIVLKVSALLRELISALPQTEDGSLREKLMTQLILHELSEAKTSGIRITLPTEKRLRVLCESLIAKPDLNRTLADWAKHVGASERTLARLFKQDLGMTFGQWRQQIKLAHAAPLLARGIPLSLVATQLGYANQSAFSAMFKKVFGQSPSTLFTASKKIKDK